MSDAEPTLLSERSGRVASLTLNRPHRLNALSPALLQALKAELDAIAADDEVSVVVIRGAGRSFCVGYDLNEEDWILSQFPANFEGAVDAARDRADIARLVEYWLDLWRFPKPIIAAVDGHCLSGGGELLAIADLAVASDRASFGHPAGRNLGIPVTLSFWPVLIGMRKTRELLYTAKLIDAHEAARIGLINEVVPADRLDAHVEELARTIAKTPVACLEVHKQATSRWFENMGLYGSTRTTGDLDSIFHQSPTYVEFFALARERGLQGALAEREQRYG